MSRPSLTDRLRGIIGGGDETGAIPRLAPELRTPHADDIAGVRRAGTSAFAGSATADSPEHLRRRSVPAARTSAAAAQHAAEVLGGEWVDRAGGRVLIVERFYDRRQQYGRESIDEIIDTLTDGAEAIATLDDRWPSSGARPRLLFLDLETTGLAGGAGTQAFLVGCALVEEDGIRVRQFVLPGYEHERALLAEVAASTNDEHGLVTFNGRSFDLPLIETRFLFHRLRFPLADVPHLDMLHPARRLWKSRPAIAGPPFDPFGELRVDGERSRTVDEDSCRLSVLERRLAGVHRVGDVPGFEIPSRYFQFVRDGNARPLEAVLEHNRLDLLSLALVTARAIRLIERGPAHTSHAWESVGLGRIYERAEQRREAEACYMHAAELARRIGREPGSPPRGVGAVGWESLARAEALRRLALCRRREGRLHEAALAWEELLELPGVPGALRHDAREALAIHYEHRRKDLRTARMLVMDALADGHTEARRRAATYRLQRLERKLSVRTEGGLLAALDAAL